MVLLIAFFIAACAGIAQQPDADSIIRLKVRQVVVPVIVTDSKGNHITGLRAADFAIYEESVRQDIAAFSTDVSAAVAGAVTMETPRAGSAPERSSGPSAATPPKKHTYVICIDTLHTSFASFSRAQAALKKLFDKEKSAGAQFVLISLGRRLQVVQAATDDSSLMAAKIQSKDFLATFGNFETADFANELNTTKKKMEQYCGTCPCGRRATQRKDVCNIRLQQIRTDIDAQAHRWASYDAAFFDGFKRLLEELARIDGPRTLVLVSDGFAIKPGKEFYVIASGYLPNSPYFTFDPPENLQPVLDQCMKIASERNIVVDAIDARGLYSPSFQPGGLSDASSAQMGTSARSNRGGTVLEDIDSRWSSMQFDNGSAMSQLARATGGVSFHDNNDLLHELRTVLADGREYYVLAYVPKNAAADGKFRRITIELKDKKATVRAKAGYWAEQSKDSEQP